MSRLQRGWTNYLDAVHETSPVLPQRGVLTLYRPVTTRALGENLPANRIRAFSSGWPSWYVARPNVLIEKRQRPRTLRILIWLIEVLPVVVPQGKSNAATSMVLPATMTRILPRPAV